MRLNSIKCINYRQYRDLEISFPKTKNNDIHIVEASNGVGKTNLLNALNWCLYGDEPHIHGATNSDSSSVAQQDVDNTLPIYNTFSMKEAKENGESELIVSVEVMIEWQAESYFFQRQGKYKVLTGFQIGRDEVQCKVISFDGSTKFLTEEEVNDVVGHMLPKDIREYFYFDGEQLFTYFTDVQRRNIKKKVYNIAQINILDSVAKHLKVISDEYAGEVSRNNPDFEEKKSAVKALEDAIEAQKEKINAFASEIAIADDEIRAAENIINGQERLADKNRILKGNEEQIEKIEKDIETVYKLKRNNIIKDFATKILLYNVNRKIFDYVAEREKRGTSFSVRASDIDESINACKCKLCGGELTEQKIREMQSLLEKIKDNASAQKICSVKEAIMKHLDIGEYESEKSSVLRLINDAGNEVQQLKEENDNIHREMIFYGGSEGVADIEFQIRKKEDFKRRRDGLISDKTTAEIQLKTIEDNLKNANQELQLAVRKQAQYDSAMKRYEFTENAKQLVDEIIDDIAKTCRENIAARTTELFSDLIWKKDEYGYVKLSEDYSLQLFTKDEISCLKSCSAAEVQLVALAFTLAVHEVSGFDSFLMIDTPAGRVSDLNRRNFAKVLLTVSEGKQIILNVTPSEYRDELNGVLDDEEISSYAKLNLRDGAVFKEV